MAPPAINTANLALGYAILWTAAADTAKPTANFGGVISGWTYVGATNEGITWGKSTDVNDLFVEESSTAVMTATGQGRFSFSGQLAEVSPANIAFVMGGGSLTGSAGSE